MSARIGDWDWGCNTLQIRQVPSAKMVARCVRRRGKRRVATVFYCAMGEGIVA